MPEEWTHVEWDDLKKGNYIRFEAARVAVEGRVFESIDERSGLRVELNFSSPTMGFLKSCGFRPYKQVV